MKKSKYLKILLLFVLMTLFAIKAYAEDEIAETTSDGWTDFSKAECTLEKDGHNVVNLFISNVEYNSDNSNNTFYYYITGDNNEPTINEESSKILTYDSTNKELHKDNCEADIELNQELYLWVLEKKYENGEYKYNFGIKGEKLDRPIYPTYANVFWATFLSNSDSQILFNVPWSNTTHRKINLKIGKISNNDILKAIKENTNVGLEALLQYSKTAETIYNKQLGSSKNVNGMSAYGYNSIHDDSPVLNLSLENEAYYFMYAELDDENGKYYPVEGITLARASTYENGNWYLHFLGDESFKWSLSDSVSTEEPTISDKTDTTVAPIKLPNTGKTTIFIVIISMLIINIKLAIGKYKKYKGV